MYNLFPKKLTITTILLTLILLGGLIVEIWHAEDTLKNIQGRHLPTIKLNNTLIRINETIAHSIQMSVETGNIKWEEEYNSNKERLKQTFQELSTLVPEEYTAVVNDLQKTRKDLENSEMDIFNLVRENKWEDTLFQKRDQYLDDISLFSDNVTALTNHLDEHVSIEVNKNKQRIKIIGVSSIIGLILWFVLWVILIRAFNHNVIRTLAAERAKEEIQAQLVQSSKLASLGQLAAGIAHELNNPLTSIMGNTKLIMKLTTENETSSSNTLSSSLDTNSIHLFANNIESIHSPASKNCEELLNTTKKQLHEKADKIYNSSIRMKKIIAQMKTFSREHKEDETIEIDLNQTIRNSIIFFEAQLKLKNINIELDLDNNLPMILGEETQLESVFLNFISNSEDAFENINDDRNKKITFSTKFFENQCKIIYSDNATGIPQTVINKIFEPFFTTKEVGKGTGLGMYITHNIIQKFKGRIGVISEVGKGTTFTIVFPPK